MNRSYDWGDPPPRRIDWRFLLFVVGWTLAMAGAALIGGLR